MSFTNSELTKYQFYLKQKKSEFMNSKPKRKFPTMKQAMKRISNHSKNADAIGATLVKWTPNITWDKYNKYDFTTTTNMGYSLNLFTEINCLLSETFPMSERFEFNRAKGVSQFNYVANDLAFVFHAVWIAKAVMSMCLLALEGTLPSICAKKLVAEMTANKTKESHEQMKKLEKIKKNTEKKPKKSGYKNSNEYKICKYFVENRCKYQDAARCSNGYHTIPKLPGKKL